MIPTRPRPAFFATLALIALALVTTVRADDTAGPVIGIGTGIEMVKNHPTIISVLHGSPASRNGVHPGDRIVAIDEKSVDGLDIHQVGQLLRGAENSRIHLTVDRNGHELNFSLRRKILTLIAPLN